MNTSKFIASICVGVMLLGQITIADAKGSSGGRSSSSFSSSSRSSSSSSSFGSFSSSSKSSSASISPSSSASKPSSSPSSSPSSTASSSAKPSGGWGFFGPSKPASAAAAAPVAPSQTAKELSASTQKANTSELYRNAAVGATAGAVAGSVASNSSNSSNSSTSKPTSSSAPVLASGTTTYRQNAQPQYQSNTPIIVNNSPAYIPVPIFIPSGGNHNSNNYNNNNRNNNYDSSDLVRSVPDSALPSAEQAQSVKTSNDSGSGWIWFFVIMGVGGVVGYVIYTRMNRPKTVIKSYNI